MEALLHDLSKRQDVIEKQIAKSQKLSRQYNAEALVLTGALSEVKNLMQHVSSIINKDDSIRKEKEIDNAGKEESFSIESEE